MNHELARRCDRINRVGAHLAVWAMLALTVTAFIVANVTA